MAKKFVKKLMNGMLYTTFDPPRDIEDYEDFANFVLHDLIVL